MNTISSLTSSPVTSPVTSVKSSSTVSVPAAPAATVEISAAALQIFTGGGTHGSSNIIWGSAPAR